MSKFRLKNVIVLLVVVFCMGVLQTAVTAQDDENGKTTEDNKKSEIPSKILVPDNGFTIVLRAPTSKNRHIVKVSKNGEENNIPEYKMSDNIPEFKVSLPKNTPIFFRVDHVNTALYSVEIVVKEISDSGTVYNPFGELPILKEILKKLRRINGINGDPDSVTLKSKLEAVGFLDEELNRFLQWPEKQQFYVPNTMKNFQQIQDAAAESAKKHLKLFHGTSQEVRKKSEEVSRIFNKKHDDLVEQIVAAYGTVANKLAAIENAVWYKNDTQTRILKNEIRYT